jgi:hypothetical protein
MYRRRDLTDNLDRTNTISSLPLLSYGLTCYCIGTSPSISELVEEPEAYQLCWSEVWHLAAAIDRWLLRPRL